MRLNKLSGPARAVSLLIGALILMGAGPESVTYTYDSLGRLASAMGNFTTDAGSYYITYAYDNAGNRTTVATVPLACTNVTGWTIPSHTVATYSYSPLGNCPSAWPNSVSIVSVTSPTGSTHPGSTSFSSTQIKWTPNNNTPAGTYTFSWTVHDSNGNVSVAATATLTYP